MPREVGAGDPSEGKHGLTPEERAAKEKSRTISDAELLHEGAEYEIADQGEKLLVPTDEQVELARREMEEDLESRKTEFEKLKEAITASEREKMEELWKGMHDLYSPRLSGYLRAWLGRSFPRSAPRNESLVRDAEQFAFMQLYLHFDKIETDPMPWLMVVGRRKLRDMARVQNRYESMEQGQERAQLSLQRDVEDAGPSPEEIVQASEMAAVIAAAVDGTKSEGLRRTAKMMYEEGLSDEEIMEREGISGAALRQRKHRVRDHINAALEVRGLVGKDEAIMPRSRKREDQAT